MFAGHGTRQDFPVLWIAHQRADLFISSDEVAGGGLNDVWFKHDPFDLALTSTIPKLLERLPALLAARLEKVRAMLAEGRRINEGARPHVGLVKQWALRHTEYRLEAEVAYLTDLLANVSNVMLCERAQQQSSRLPEADGP